MSTQSEEIRAEIGTLRAFLESLSEDSVIERHQLEHRIRTAQQRLASIQTAFEPNKHESDGSRVLAGEALQSSENSGDQ